MKKSILLVLCLCSLMIIINSCKKNKPTELDKLPAATQTGANTFGCLVNGKAWTPKGYYGATPNFMVMVQPNASGNIIDIRVYNLETNNSTSFYIGCIITPNNNLTYNFENDNSPNFGFNTNNCEISVHDSLYRRGSITITKYDLSLGIISGIFNCSLFRANCGDTIKITNGRFDAKL